jgi:hypothetical protein
MNPFKEGSRLCAHIVITTKNLEKFEDFNRATRLLTGVTTAYDDLIRFFELANRLGDIANDPDEYGPQIRRKSAISDREFLNSTLHDWLLRDDLPFPWKPTGSDILYLHRAEFSSPGIIELIGKLNPLEQIRLYIQERHERKISREKARVEIAHDYLDLLQKTTLMLRDAGVKQADIRRILERRIIQPLTALDDLKSSDIVENFSVIEVIPAESLPEFFREKKKKRLD